MGYGFVKVINSGLGFFRTMLSATYVGVKPPTTDPSTSFDITLFSALPSTTEAVTISATGQLGTQALSGGGGTVTQVALTAPAPFSVGGSPITSNGTLALSYASQTAGTFLASPAGSAGSPSMRAIVFTDIASLIGSSSSTVAAGNDSRFHLQGADAGTTQSSFQIDSGNSGSRLAMVSGVLRARNAANNADANFAAANVTVSGDLTVQGTTTTINSETLTISDNVIVLNDNVTTGTPTENGGIQVRRGGSTSASVLWREATDDWAVGLAGSELPIARYVRASFTSANVTGGVYTFTHNLANQYPEVFLVTNGNERIAFPDGVTYTNANSAAIDMTFAGTISGTWQAVALG